MELTKGTLLALTSGEYSDYQLHRVVRTLQDFDADEILREFLEKKPDLRGDFKFNRDLFMYELEKDGLVETVECLEWHVDSYETVSDEESYINPL